MLSFHHPCLCNSLSRVVINQHESNFRPPKSKMDLAICNSKGNDVNNSNSNSNRSSNDVDSDGDSDSNERNSGNGSTKSAATAHTAPGDVGGDPRWGPTGAATAHTAPGGVGGAPRWAPGGAAMAHRAPGGVGDAEADRPRQLRQQPGLACSSSNSSSNIDSNGNRNSNIHSNDFKFNYGCCRWFSFTLHP